MEKVTKFNLRVYGLLIHNESLLVLKEKYAGQILYKLPGGGIEFGEGITDALKRECLEELNLSIQSIEHFYTQDDFIKSQFRQHEQLHTFYYIVPLEDISSFKVLDSEIEEIQWIPFAELTPQVVNLPIDQRVIELFLKKINP